MLQVRHAELLAEVIGAIRAVSPDPGEDIAIEADHCLLRDLSLGSRQIFQVFELLEEALGLCLPPSDAMDFVIAGPSVGRLVRTLAGIQREGKRHGS